MNMWFVDSTAGTMLWLVVQATVLLGVSALLYVLTHRRASAAARHLLWVSALGSLLLLPAVSRVVPSLPVIVTAKMLPPVSVPERAEASAELQTQTPSSIEAVAPATTAIEEPHRRDYSLAAWLYAAGVVALIMVWLAERWQLHRFIRRATAIDDPEWARLFSECTKAMGVVRPVVLLKSRDRNVPMAIGTRRPAIIIPAIAETWDEERRRAVLLHELAHVARFDCFTQSLALAACAMYWFHPAVWMVAKRLRIERELACDDRVIAAGTEAREYASHLLEIAYSFAAHRAPALAVCMARPRQLEGRMLAALDSARNRRLPSTRVRVAGAAVVVAILGTIAAARPVLGAAEEPPASSDQQWPSTVDKATLSATKAAVEREMKEIVGIPVRGMKEVRAAVRAASSLAGVPQENVPGTWEIRPTETKGIVHLRIVELHSSTGTNVAIDQLEGLTGAQLNGAGGPVQFKVRRDAGTFTFEGIIRNGVGAGTFTFAADTAFPGEMAKRGFARPTADQQYQLARHDIGFPFIDELTKQGYGKPQTSELVRAGQHGVQAEYLRDMAALGYRLGTLDALIMLRDHGVTPAYVRELADSGYKALSADAIREARDHGVSPEYVRALRDAGYSSVPIDEVIRVRDHGVTPEYVRGLGDAGYRKLPLDQLVRVRDHGVTTEYVRDMRQLGYSLTIEELVRARDHGVTVEYVRDMAALGYAGQPMDSLIRLRDHGVTPEYAREVKALGYDKLSLDDLVTLRDHGLTAERIRSANSRAGTRLPIDMLKSFSGGLH